jgi:signal peptidase II
MLMILITKWRALNKGMKRKIILILLVLADQIIKYIIYFNYMQFKISFYGQRIGFVPFINKEQLSIFDNELNFQLSLVTLILINIGSLILLLATYVFVKKRGYINYHFKNAFVFITAGAISSLIDKMVFGGSLDYILFFKYICDLKDIYLIIGLILISIYTITYIKHERKLKCGSVNEETK